MSEIVRNQSIAASVWERSNDDELLRERSHWRGVGKYRDDRVWLAIGRGTLRQVRVLQRLIGAPPLARRSMHCLEWGPGGGSNAVALAPYLYAYTAVDISSANLGETERQAHQVGLERVHKIHLRKEPGAEISRIAAPVELFISTAVFQHFPDHDYAHHVLTAVHSVMASDAIGVVQIRFDNGNARFRQKSPGSYRDNYLTATSFPIDHFWNLLSATGFMPLACVRIDIARNYATFLFERRK